MGFSIIITLETKPYSDILNYFTFYMALQGDSYVFFRQIHFSLI